MKNHYMIVFAFALFFSAPAMSQVFSVPYSDNFDAGSPGWSSTNLGGTGWELGSPNFGITNSTYSGANCWDINLTSAYTNTLECYLVTPAIDVSGTAGVKISFWQNRNCELYWDGFRMEFTDDTVSGFWSVVGSVNAQGSLNWYNSTLLNSSGLPGWGGQSAGWELSSILLPAFSSSVVYFRFVFTTDASVTMDGLSIDNFAVEAVAMNSITGTVYVDANYNNVIDAGDFPAQNLSMNSVPNGGYYYYPTNANGFYTFFADSAINTTVSPVLPPYATAIPANYIINIPGSNQVSSGNDFLLTFQPGIVDPQITITTTPVRPGFVHYKTMTLTNLGTTFISGTVELAYGSAYTLVNTSEPYTVIGTNEIEFTYSALMPMEQRSIVVAFETSPTLPVGQATTAVATIYPMNGDQNTANNTSEVSTITVNSCDPNNKLVDPEEDVLVQDVAAGIDLHYTVNFQNTGTASAIYVNIFDILDENLDINTFQVTGSSHPITSWNIGSNRQVQFTFVNINLPDSNANEPASHGYVSYSIRPLTTLVVGEEITNTASIVFDFNPAIETNSVTTTVVNPVGLPDNSNGTIYLYPNPASGLINFTAAENFNRYRILNAIGQQVAENSISQPGQLQSVSLGELASGLYILVVSDDFNTAKTPFMIE